MERVMQLYIISTIFGKSLLDLPCVSSAHLELPWKLTCSGQILFGSQQQRLTAVKDV